MRKVKEDGIRYFCTVDQNLATHIMYSGHEIKNIRVKGKRGIFEFEESEGVNDAIRAFNENTLVRVLDFCFCSKKCWSRLKDALRMASEEEGYRNDKADCGT